MERRALIVLKLRFGFEHWDLGSRASLAFGYFGQSYVEEMIFQHHSNTWVSPAIKLLRCIEGHGKAGDEEIGKGEADQEVVVDAPQLPVEEHAGDHQQVGEDRHNDDGSEKGSLAEVEKGEL